MEASYRYDDWWGTQVYYWSHDHVRHVTMVHGKLLTHPKIPDFFRFRLPTRTDVLFGCPSRTEISVNRSPLDMGQWHSHYLCGWLSERWSPAVFTVNTDFYILKIASGNIQRLSSENNFPAWIYSSTEVIRYFGFASDFTGLFVTAIVGRVVVTDRFDDVSGSKSMFWLPTLR